MKTRAAVAFEAKRPLEIVEVDLEGPKLGEVLLGHGDRHLSHRRLYGGGVNGGWTSGQRGGSGGRTP